MAEAVVGLVADAICNLLTEEAKFLHGVSDHAEELQLELDRLRSFLRHAEARHNEGRDVTVWISQSRDLVYEAQDLLEIYAFKIESQKENIFKRSACILNECYVRHSLGSEIRKLRSKIRGLTKGFQHYGINAIRNREVPESSSQQWQTREILQGILIKFFPTQRDEIAKWGDEELIRKLFETVQKRVVLDDIWSIDA